MSYIHRIRAVEYVAVTTDQNFLKTTLTINQLKFGLRSLRISSGLPFPSVIRLPPLFLPLCLHVGIIIFVLSARTTVAQ